MNTQENITYEGSFTPDKIIEVFKPTEYGYTTRGGQLAFEGLISDADIVTTLEAWN